MLERALGLPAQGKSTFELALARNLLGRALVESHRDRARGLAMVRATRSEIAGAANSADQLRKLDRWLLSDNWISPPLGECS